MTNINPELLLDHINFLSVIAVSNSQEEKVRRMAAASPNKLTRGSRQVFYERIKTVYQRLEKSV